MQKTELKSKLRACNKFLTFLKDKPQYKQTFVLFKAVRKDLVTEIKNSKNCG
jgi:uncharacterized membrane protein YfbV (UPF0208 family)